MWGTDVTMSGVVPGGYTPLKTPNSTYHEPPTNPAAVHHFRQLLTP